MGDQFCRTHIFYSNHERHNCHNFLMKVYCSVMNIHVCMIILHDNQLKHLVLYGNSLLVRPLGGFPAGFSSNAKQVR